MTTKKQNPVTVTKSVEQLNMRFRAISAVPALDLDPGADLHITLSADGATMARDGYQPEKVGADELHDIHIALRDGALEEALSLKPSIDDVKKLIEARVAFLTAALKAEAAQIAAGSQK